MYLLQLTKHSSQIIGFCFTNVWRSLLQLLGWVFSLCCRECQSETERKIISFSMTRSTREQYVYCNFFIYTISPYSFDNYTFYDENVFYTRNSTIPYKELTRFFQWKNHLVCILDWYVEHEFRVANVESCNVIS